MLDLARKKISIFSIVKLCARYSPTRFVMCLALTVMDGLLVPLMVVVVANFIDSAITLASKDPQTYIVMKNAIFMGLGYWYATPRAERPVAEKATLTETLGQ